jgi:translation elongation factor aEF-1 beta
MGDVAIRFKILPDSASADYAEIKARILALGPRELKEIPIAFGLKFFDVLFVVPDKEGQKFEDQLKSIPGIASVETEGVTLI